MIFRLTCNSPSLGDVLFFCPARTFITKVSTSNSYIFYGNSSKLCMLAYYYMKNFATKDYKIGICCFSAALRRKNKEWLAWNQDNVSEWGDMSIHRMLFQ